MDRRLALSTMLFTAGTHGDEYEGQIVLVAGLCSQAPAFEVMRPAGIAP